MSEEALELPDEKLLLKIWSEFGLNQQRIKEAVGILNNWLDQQPHLPKEKGKIYIYIYLFIYLFIY